MLPATKAHHETRSVAMKQWPRHWNGSAPQRSSDLRKIGREQFLKFGAASQPNLEPVWYIYIYTYIFEKKKKLPASPSWFLCVFPLFPSTWGGRAFQIFLADASWSFLYFSTAGNLTTENQNSPNPTMLIFRKPWNLIFQKPHCSLKPLDHKLVSNISSRNTNFNHPSKPSADPSADPSTPPHLDPQHHQDHAGNPPPKGLFSSTDGWGSTVNIFTPKMGHHLPTKRNHTVNPWRKGND